MKHIFEYLFSKKSDLDKINTWTLWGVDKYSNNIFYQKLGTLHWEFKSTDSNIDELVTCSSWYVAKWDTIFVFWSPENTWMICTDISESGNCGTDSFWYLVSGDHQYINYKDPKEVCRKVFYNWEKYLANSATIFDLDFISIPLHIRNIIKEMK